jgi:transposase
MAQVQVISGIERRRRWSEEQKRQIVQAAFAPGATVSEVARQADICNGAIYRWRRELQWETAGFTKVAVIGDSTGVADPGGAAIDVALGNGARIRIPSSIGPELAASVVKALVRR